MGGGDGRGADADSDNDGSGGGGGSLAKPHIPSLDIFKTYIHQYRLVSLEILRKEKNLSEHPNMG